MGRLDKRTSNEEDDRSARGATERRRVSRAEQLREAQAAAARTAAQETLVDEVYELVNEFLELMEEKGYPGLETVTLPMTRWWWPFPRPTRKAVWTLYNYSDRKRVDYIERAEGAIRYPEVKINIYLVADDEKLIFYKWDDQDWGPKPNIIFREWGGEGAKEVKKKLKELIRQYSR